MIELKLKRGKEESLDRFHPWVFSGALASEPPEDLAEGDVVGVTASDGRFIGTGHYQIGSIAVRILDFSRRDIDETFFRERLTDALRLRKTLHSSEKISSLASLHARYTFGYTSATRQGRLYPGAYQGIGLGVFSFFSHKNIGTPVGLYI